MTERAGGRDDELVAIADALDELAADAASAGYYTGFDAASDVRYGVLTWYTELIRSVERPTPQAHPVVADLDALAADAAAARGVLASEDAAALRDAIAAWSWATLARYPALET